MHTVRRVLPHEYSKYCTHLKSLDYESKILRFGYAVKDEVIDGMCDSFEYNQDHHILFCIENSQLDFVGVGHIALGNEMELAFSVLKEYQGQRIGGALMQRCIQWCRTHNILNGTMVCLSSNKVIRRLCSKHGITMTNDHGETSAEIHLPPADVGTYMAEALDHNAAVLSWITKRALWPLTTQTRQLEVRSQSSL